MALDSHIRWSDNESRCPIRVIAGTQIGETQLMTTLKRIALAGALLLLVAMTATPANNAEQIVFSTPGSTMQLSDGSNTDFGFWIWCAGQAAPRSQGGYQNANACQGAMYFYDVFSHSLPFLGDVAEGPDGIYTETVFQETLAQLQKNGFVPNSEIVCTLTNTIPDGGHTVTVHCDFLALGISGDATVNNAVVNVTGPN
jgi:hypothetical protein